MEKEYLLFNMERTGFDDGYGKEVNLEAHLLYLKTNLGTPDCWSSVTTDNVVDVIKEAEKSGLHIAIVDVYDNYKIIGYSKPEDDS